MIDEQEWLEAWNSQRAGPIVELADPDVEVHAVTLGIEGRHYQGHDGLRQWMRDVRDRFNARVANDSITLLGDDAVLICGHLFIADELGGEEAHAVALVCHLRNDRAIWIGTFFSATDARAAYRRGLTGPTGG